MRTILVILFIVTCCPGLFAQEVVATAGSILSNSSGSISYTIGEGVANTLTKGDKTITQGFQQGNLSVSIVSVLKDLDFSISVFPNPTSDVLTLKLNKEDMTGLKYLLFDMNGRLLSQKNLESNETTINVKLLNNGLYLLKVQDGKKELKSFKIVKN
jgi:hypothetical protein